MDQIGLKDIMNSAKKSILAGGDPMVKELFLKKYSFFTASLIHSLPGCCLTRGSWLDLKRQAGTLSPHREQCALSLLIST